MTKKEAKEYEHFILDLLFMAVSADDHEDAMGEILEAITEPDVEFDLNDVMYAAQFASMYHEPTSFEEEALNDVRFTLAFRELNG